MYENQTYEVIKQRSLDNTMLDIDKREGSVTNTFLSGNAMTLAKGYIDMGGIKNTCFIKNGYSEKLEDRVWEFGLSRKLGKKATGKVVITGNEGTVLANGTVFLCNDLSFIMLNDVEIGVGDNMCYLEALEVGTKYNLSPNSEFKLQMANSDVKTITNNEDFAGGIDIETDEELIARFRKVVSNPSTSGNKYHYEEWALEVDGVSKAYVYPLWNGNGTVKVMIVGKESKPVSQEIIESCKYHIEDVMPIGAQLTVTTPTELTINVSAKVELKNGYDIADVKVEFESVLAEYLASAENEIVYTKILGLLSSVTGIDDFNTLTVNGNTTNIVVSVDKLPVVGTTSLVEVV